MKTAIKVTLATVVSATGVTYGGTSELIEHMEISPEAKYEYFLNKTADEADAGLYDSVSNLRVELPEIGLNSLKEGSMGPVQYEYY